MERFKILSNSNLKLIAIITMLIDHIGFCLAYYHPVLTPYYQQFRDIGRIAFPIFCFLLIEGFHYTSSRKRYATSLFIFALISELPFDFAFNAGRTIWHSQNVFFTLFIGLIAIWIIEYLRYDVRLVEQPILKLLLQAIIGAASMGLAYLMKTDYDWKGIALILIFYVFRSDMSSLTIFGAIALSWEWKAIFAFIPLNMYNGKRGWMKGAVAKYAFYVFYPAHLLILAWVRYYILNIQMLPVF